MPKKIAFRDVHDPCFGFCSSRSPLRTSRPVPRACRKSFLVFAAVKLRDVRNKMEVLQVQPKYNPPDTCEADSSPTVVTPSLAWRDVNRYVTTSIAKAESWQDLEVILTSYSTYLNYIHVSAMVSRLPKVVAPSALPRAERRFNKFLRQLSDAVARQLPNFDPRAVANVLWAVSKLGYSPAPPLLDKFLFEAYVKMYDFKAQELANLSWALAILATLGNKPVPVWLDKFTVAAIPKVSKLKPQELAHMTWAVSKLFPPVSFASQVTPQQEALHPNLTTNTSSSVTMRPVDHNAKGNSHTASTGPKPTSALRELVASLAAHAAASLPHFRCGELVMTIVSLHRLDPQAGAQLLRKALDPLLRTHAAELSPQDFANLWLVLGQCATKGLLGKEVTHPPRATHALEGAAVGAPTARMPGGSSSSSNQSGRSHSPGQEATKCGNLAVATATISRGPFGLPVINADVPSPTLQASRAAAPCRRDLGRHHLYALLELTHRSLPSFTAQGLCTLLVALVRLRMQPEPQLMHGIFLQYMRVLPAQATFQCVAITLWACAMLRVRPDPAIMSRFMVYARLQLPAARPGELMPLMWALQRLLFRPSRLFFHRLSDRLVAMLPELQPHGIDIAIRLYLVFGMRLPAAVRTRALNMVTAFAAAAAAAAATQKHAQAEATAKVAETVATAPPHGTNAPQPEAALATSTCPTPDVSSPALIRRISPLGPSPAMVVRFFATLTGVGMTVPRSAYRRSVAARLLLALRWRLETSASQRTALLKALTGATLGRLHSLSTDALCALLTSLCRLQLRPCTAFRTEVHRVVATRLRELAPWQAGGLLAALGKMHSRPPPQVMRGLLEGVLEPNFGMLTGHQLLSVLCALVRLRYRPSAKWLGRYMEVCMPMVDKWPSACLVVLLRSLHGLRLRLLALPCQHLQRVVKRRTGKDVVRGQGAGPKLKESLCQVCSDLTGCEV